ncbi:MAG: type I-E CRISPR-associated protein Cas6/Cse3/CasE [Amphritea sp.]|nr:type I-E CRISPR-associated protein Cas6/Cse3/CasE [Amphritea sp.]
MSYLSKISLKPEIRQSSQLALLIADNQYGMHRLLWDLFPNRDGQTRDFLFREERDNEQGGQSAQPVYYLLSPELPQQDSPLFHVQSKSYEPQLKSGDRLQFRLRVNPVISRRIEGAKRSAVHDVVMDAQQRCLAQLCSAAGLPAGQSKADKLNALRTLPAGALQPVIQQCLPDSDAVTLSAALDWAVRQAQIEWLAGSRAERCGYTIDQPDALKISGYRWHSLPQKGRKAGFSALDYEGILTVTDPELFLKTLNQGIGKARAFGCGLMLVRPIR